ncbi:RNA polymerase factor sigma-54, partial [Campylobacter novaezeelandiae]|nr:RNA polymerase factor sigma-54 [Campylobacter novaezeelandiae]
MLKQKLAPKNKLSQTLRSWLPILQANIEDLKENLDEFSKENPFINIKENVNTQANNKNYIDYFYKNSTQAQNLQHMAITQKSVYEILNEQIIPPLFPTEKSQKIAYKIIECLN